MKYLLLSVLMPLVFCLRTARADEAGAHSKPSITVAAIPFHQASAKETCGPLAEAVGDLLVARLEAVEGLTFVDRSAIDKVLEEQKLALAVSQDDRVRVGKIVGARFVLAGSVVPLGDTFQVTAHLLDVSTARVVRSAQVAARSDRLMEPLDKLARQLAGDLNLKLPELNVAADRQVARGQSALHARPGLLLCQDARRGGRGIHEGTCHRSFARPRRFWNGMAYFDQGEFDHAKLEFARFLKQFDKHALAPRAKELMGKCEAQLRKPRREDRRETSRCPGIC